MSKEADVLWSLSSRSISSLAIFVGRTTPVVSYCYLVDENTQNMLYPISPLKDWKERNGAQNNTKEQLVVMKERSSKWRRPPLVGRRERRSTVSLLCKLGLSLFKKFSPFFTLLLVLASYSSIPGFITGLLDPGRSWCDSFQAKGSWWTNSLFAGVLKPAIPLALIFVK